MSAASGFNFYYQADAVLVGASNGLSIADGYNIFADNAWFRRNFGDLRNRYGIRSVLQGAFYPYQTLEEKWGFAARLVSRTYFDAAPDGPCGICATCWQAKKHSF